MNCGPCKDCRFWNTDETRWRDTKKLGHGECQGITMSTEPKAYILYQHDEPALSTPPDFGCVQFEAK